MYEHSRAKEVYCPPYSCSINKRYSNTIQKAVRMAPSQNTLPFCFSKINF